MQQLRKKHLQRKLQLQKRLRVLQKKQLQPKKRLQRKQQLLLKNQQQKRLQQKKRLNKNLVFFKTDIQNTKKLNSIFKKYRFDCVINLAAQAGVDADKAQQWNDAKADLEMHLSKQIQTN